MRELSEKCRRASWYTSEDIHGAVFPKAKPAASLEDMDEGIKARMKKYAGQLIPMWSFACWRARVRSRHGVRKCLSRVQRGFPVWYLLRLSGPSNRSMRSRRQQETV